MRPRQKYVPLTEAKILVTPSQQDFVVGISHRRGDSINQVVRDMIQHCLECPFFMSNGSTNGSIPSTEKP